MAAGMALTLFAIGMVVFTLVASLVSFWSILPELDELRVECDRDWANLERLLAERLVEVGKLDEHCQALPAADPRRPALVAMQASCRAFTSAEGIPARAVASRALSGAVKQVVAAGAPLDAAAVPGLAEARARLEEIEGQLEGWIELFNRAVDRWNALPRRLAGNAAARFRAAAPREPWRGSYEDAEGSLPPVNGASS